MDNLLEIKEILTRAGYSVLKNCPGDSICIIDPTCVWPPLLNFIHTGWIIIAVITGFLLAGWGITMVRGAKHDMIQNLRTLILIFGTLSVALPAVNLMGGGTAIVNQCNTIQISTEQTQELLDMLNQNKFQQESYEFLDIQDSAFDDDTTTDSDINF